VLGYSVVDQNYPILAKLVSELNKYNEQMAELRTCVDKAVGMVQNAPGRIGDARKMLTLQAPGENTEGLLGSVTELLTCMQAHWKVVDQAFAVFKHAEVCKRPVYPLSRRACVDNGLIPCAPGLPGNVQFYQIGDKVCKIVCSALGEQVRSLFYPISQ
jgi:hypothetical protein